MARRLAALAAAVALAGCGGGGSDPGVVGTPPPPAPPPPPEQAALAGTGAVALVAARQLLGNWDGTLSSAALAPGMKVLFYGTADSCIGVSDGPVGGGADAVFAATQAQTGFAAATLTARWTPLSSAPACGGVDGDRSGPSYVVMDADTQTGGMGLYTQAGPQAGGAPFLSVFDAGGQFGDGSNAGIVGSFVAFRQDWTAAEVLRPFVGTAGRMQIHSIQAITVLDPGLPTADASVVQAKQALVVGLLNPNCMAAGLGAQHRCQLQYQFEVAIARAGVDDWSTQGWFKPRVMFDRAQGGVPVVDSPLPASGVDSVEPDSGFPLFTSLGAATVHTPTPAQDYAAQIDFVQLQAALRLIVSHELGEGVGAVTDADIAASWGSHWNDANAWVLLETRVGQEVFDPLDTHAAAVGGSFRDINISAPRSLALPAPEGPAGSAPAEPDAFLP